MPKPLALKRKIRLQWLLIVPFVVQVVGAVGLVGYLSFRNGQKAVNDLANQLMLKTGELVKQHLDVYLATPVRINQSFVDALELGLLDLKDLGRIERFFWKQVRLTKVSYVNIGFLNGDYAGAGVVNSQDPGITVSETSIQTGHRNRSFATDDQGQRTQRLNVFDDYDHRKEAWYIDTLKLNRPNWSPVYLWDDSVDSIAIAASRPIYDSNQKLVGAVGTDFLLTNISNFLRRLDISENGKVLILERDGSVIATSGQEQPFLMEKGQGKRLNALESRDRTSRATAQFLRQQFGTFAAIHQRQQLYGTWDGQGQFVQVMPWRDPLGLDWLVVITVPEADFMAQIQANTYLTLVLCVGALGVSVVVGLYTSQWVVRPLLRLQGVSQAIAAGDWQQPIPDSHIQELEALAQAFTQMAEQLQASFSALETTNATLEHRVEARTLELKTALQTLQQTQAQLVQTEKMSSLGQLVAGIAHEINNPVNFIHGNLNYVQAYTQDLLRLMQLYQTCYPEPPEILQEELEAVDVEFVTQDLQKIMRSMKSGTTRIQEIIVSLRNFSRLDEADCKATELQVGIDSTLLILQHRLKATRRRPDIEVVKDYGPLPLVQFYPSQMNQVLINLLNNAIDALDGAAANSGDRAGLGRSPKIWIQTSVIENTDWVRIAIADNGPGIPPEIQDKLFDPFFTTKPVGQGTGLGLSISYQIVVYTHQGRLYYDSTVTEGARFVIEIPIHQPTSVVPS